MGTTDNPFDAAHSQTGALSPEDQAEYDRLEALERDQQARTASAGDPLEPVSESSYPEHAVQIDDRDRDVPAELDQGDAETEAAYPIQNGAVKWEDAANEGNTERRSTATYDTPWGRRELSAEEVIDFEHQGVEVTRVDGEPKTSRKDEDADTESAVIGTPLKHYDDEGFEVDAKGNRV